MNTPGPAEREWHPTYWRLLVLNACHVILAILLVQPLVALARGRPVLDSDALVALVLFLVVGALLSLHQYRFRRFVLRATEGVFSYPWRAAGDHNSMKRAGLLAPSLARAARATRLPITLRVAHRDGSHLSLQPFLYAPGEREGLVAFLVAHTPAG